MAALRAAKSTAPKPIPWAWSSACGPNIRRGARVEAPCRLVDLTPTILDLTSTEYDREQLDGRALRNIFETGDEQHAGYEESKEQAAREHPVYWQDVDLKAWKPLH